MNLVSRNFFNALTLSPRASTVNDHSRARKDSLIIILGNCSVGSVNTVPDRHREWRPVHEVLGDEVTVVRTMTRRRSKMDLVKVMDHAMDRVKDWTIWVVFPASLFMCGNCVAIQSKTGTKEREKCPLRLDSDVEALPKQLQL